MENRLLILVGIIFLICVVFGYVWGFLKFGLSLFSTVITLVLVSFLSPYVSDALTKYTPIDELIEKKCIETFMPEIPVEDLLKADLSGTPLAGLDRDQIEKLNDKDWSKLGINGEDILSVLGEIPKDDQIKAIKNASIPQFLKDLLLENNNNAIYNELGVTTFVEYVASYISRMIINLISFLVTFLIAIILVKALMVAVHIIGELPVLGTVNHLAGGALGLVLGLIIVWVGFLILALAYSTDFGKVCFEMIEDSSILTFLYEHNPLLIRLLGFY